MNKNFTKTMAMLWAAGCLAACGNSQQPEQQSADSTAVETVSPSADSAVVDEPASTKVELDGVTLEDGAVTVKGVRYEFAFVERGTFTMGATSEMKDADACEKPAHDFTFDYDYYMGKTEVTVGFWKAVTGNYPPGQEGEQDLNKPVDNVSLEECQSFIEDLNALLVAPIFRPPNETEWEYAARGGNKSKHYIYSGSNTLEEVAWNEEGNIVASGYDVATKKPNELGIYDMSGNVCEWVSDGWADDYKSAPTYDGYGVIRGGNCTSSDFYCRVSARIKEHTSEKALDRYSPLHGFRLVVVNWSQEIEDEEEGL